MMMPDATLRIVSLVPSITELLYSLGLSDQVVGITKFCVHPNEWFKTKTRIGGTKNIQIEKIKALAPTLVIANKEENIKEQVEALEVFTKIHVTDVSNYKDALKMIQEIGALTKSETKATEIIATIQERFAEISRLSHKRRLQSTPCAYLIWQDPYMTIGGDTYINDLIEKMGFTNVFADATRYPSISLTDIEQSNCKVIFLSSEPYPFKQKHMDVLQKHFPNKLIMLVDGEMFSWYGSRLLAAAGYLKSLTQKVSAAL
jgi:ABC-type Fe3+-hydroxamate transport system substrate-binding protein